MNRVAIFSFLSCCLLLLTCCTSADGVGKNGLPLVDRSLEDIKKDGKLKALVTYSNTSYFLYRGQVMGFEYELLKRFADDLGLELEIVVSKNLDSLFHDLNSGKADIVAHGMTITSARQEEVAFTDYLYLTNQVLVQKKPDNWRRMKWSTIQKSLVHDPIELINDTISVRQNSSYFQRLRHLSEEIGGEIFIDTLDGNLSTGEIIQMVVEGNIKYTVADKNIASINASYYPILDIKVPISFSQRIAWAVRPNAPQLLEAANKWIARMRKHDDYYTIYRKYFKNKRRFRQQNQSEYYSLNQQSISPYDELIQTYATTLGWDWRLLAALIYQESRFDPETKSWAGAQGLMQLMPSTAQSIAVTKRTDPEASISGGTRYLKQLWSHFEAIPDSAQRIKFTMAAYNCGYAHILDAQSLAEHEGFDPLHWDDHVGPALRKLSIPKYYNLPFIRYGYVRGEEPFRYVNEIHQRYEKYVQLVQEPEGDEVVSIE